jgi:hypothetical protein
MRRLRVDTLSMGSGPTRVSDDAPTARPPPSLLPGSLELVSPVSIATMQRLRLPLFVSAPSLCRSVRDTSVPRLFSLTSNRGGVGRCSGPCFTGVALPGFLAEETGGSPSFPSNPILLCPALRPRRDPRARPLWRFGAAHAQMNTRAPPNNNSFEAQSHGFATHCLRLKTPFPVASQGSFPAAGQALPGGLIPAGSR